MEAMQFMKMIEDKSFADLSKMQYKYSKAEVKEMLEVLRSSRYNLCPLKDFTGKQVVYLEGLTKISPKYAKILLTYQSEKGSYGNSAMEEEIFNSMDIENIDTSRDSIRKILAGYAPKDVAEERIYGMKKGIEFISDYSNKITEENLHKLYQLSIGDYLDLDAKLPAGKLYRDDSVYVVGGTKTHEGLDAKLIPKYMENLIDFINVESDIDDLAKAAIVHFYMAYIHPYFDGNGRTARLLQLWYLVQRGYTGTMFLSLSSHVRESRNQYYKAYSLIEENQKISGIIDVTPFVVYFAENVYAKLSGGLPAQYTMDEFYNALTRGEITQKEHDLWNFVLNTYGKSEFSTKQLEKDYGKAAYATIRTFVQKLERLGLLSCHKYSNRPKYRIG